MKKLLLIVCMLLPRFLFGADYYVGGPGASDLNAGSSAAPFATIQKAATVAVSGDVVNIRTGVYREAIVPVQSNVTYQADVGAIVTISGLNEVTTTWTQYSGNIFSTTITLPNPYNYREAVVDGTATSLLANQIFWKGEMMHQARWPNVSTVADLFNKSNFRPASSTTTFTNTTISDPGMPTGLDTSAYVWTNGWFLSETKKVTQSATTLTYSGQLTGSEFRKFYYLTNSLTLLDVEKEWQYKSGVLYFYQPGGGLPTSVEYKARRFAFDLRNKTNITIYGINFIGCDPVNTNLNSSSIIVDHINVKYMNHDFIIDKPADNYTRGAEQTGLKLIGNNNIVRNSEIRYAGAMGVWLGQGGTADNNILEYIGYNGMWGSPFAPWTATGAQTITHNTTYKTSRGAVELTSSASGLNLEIAYNDISGHNSLCLDGGAIYSAQNHVHTGSRVHHNWFHDTGVQRPNGDLQDGIQVTGVYLDQASGPMNIDHNVHWNGDESDYYAEIKNDNGENGGSKLYNNTYWGSTEYSYVTHAAPTVTDVQRNNIYHGEIRSDNVMPDVQFDVPRTVDPLFVGGSLSSLKGLYFKLQSGSPAVNTGTNLGVPYNSGIVGTTDKGAYEYQGVDWTAGYNGIGGANSYGNTTTGPLVSLKFNEAAGVAPVNSGSTTSTFTRSTTVPASVSANVPTIVGGANSFDFGTTTGNYYVESAAAIDGLKNLTAFTLSGWLNCKSSTTGGGGNRVISWINNGGNGVDLVYQNDGSLKLGVNQWPDFSTAVSSISKVTTNAAAPAANWVFFAVTYQSDGQVKFYFGNNSTDATLDVTKSYPGQGAVGSAIGKLAIGAFNDASRAPSGTDRMFRGLIDNINIHGAALSLTEIISLQRGTDIIAPTAPTNFVSSFKTTTSISLSWTASTDNIAVTGYDIYEGATLISSIGAVTTFTRSGLTPNTSYSMTIKAKDAAGNYSTASTVLNVLTDGIPTSLISLKFNEATGVAPVNTGSATSTFTRSATTPASSATAPAGSVGGGNSFDFGTTPGDFYVESSAAINELKNLSSFTLTGWVNCKSSTAGGGGNRIISWINGGGDGVDLVYQSDGSLRLGVDQWADSSPSASSSNKVTTNAAAPAANWVFFAVTYESVPNQVKFYFGTNTNDATLDVTRPNSNQGPVGTSIGKLSIGAFNDVTRNGTTYDRMFRGLIDNINIYGSALNLTGIIAVQKALDITPPTTIASFASPSKTSTSISLTWPAASDNVGVTGYEIFDGSVLLADIAPATSYTLSGLTPSTLYSLTIKAKDAAGNRSAVSNTVAVTTSTIPSALIKLRLNEATGVAPVNSGTATSTFTRSATTPASNNNVPTSVGGANSFDFGTTTGDYYVESSAVINQLKSLTSFTVSGWVNCRSSTTGPGGNRIVSWINNGGNGVDIIYQSDGSLKVGVNQWPDFSPAVSSTGKVTTNASATAANWVFFAITYQSTTGAVQFYFGTNSTNATLDVSSTYSGQGAVGTSIGKLAIGAFNDASRAPSGTDRMFRGLIDEVRIHGAVLTPQDIVYIQRTSNGAGSARSNVEETSTVQEVLEETSDKVSHLYQNFPNPFSDVTEIGMFLPQSVKAARLKIIDLNGRSMYSNEITTRGKTSVIIRQNELTSGMYFYYLMADGKVVEIKKMIVLK